MQLELCSVSPFHPQLLCIEEQGHVKHVRNAERFAMHVKLCTDEEKNTAF